MTLTVRQRRILKKLKNTQDPVERRRLLEKLAVEQARSVRARLEPPLRRKSVLIPLDRETELAVEFVKTHLPRRGGRAIEFSQWCREVLCQAARELGWKK
ncbi:MAG: hypothetical protein D6784_18580 [Chloroflexi bacterium]|nr:MAG: hypothetical protein D6784_18580 [Chloroflexota bacterium]